MSEKYNKYYRTITKNIEETPKSGVYMTKEDQSKCLLIGILACAFTYIISAIIHSKN